MTPGYGMLGAKDRDFRSVFSAIHPMVLTQVPFIITETEPQRISYQFA
jgi:hypothetical protein